MKHPVDGPRFKRILPDRRRALLIEAGLACLAKGGILAFTIDNICREAGTSRGLIVHHFGSKEGLLAAVYAAAYDRLLATVAPLDGTPPDLPGLIEAIFSADTFNRDSLNIWLALWGQIATNPDLQAEHRKHYALYRESLARAIGEAARARNVKIDSYELAVVLISLVDGLWLEQCIDPGLLSANRARELCYRMLETALGPLPRPAQSPGG